MSLRSRLVRSFGATILGPGVTILVQLVNVPVMLRFWGAQLFGEWLLITTIPNYLLLSDLGFGNVASSDMTIRAHAGDREGAIETYQSTALLVWTVTLVIGLLLTLLIVLLPLHNILHLTAMSVGESRLTLLLLSINCLLILQWNVLMAAYRCDDKYAIGMLYINAIRLVEGVSFLVLLFSKAGPVQLALLMLSISIVGTIWLIYKQHNLIPWLKFGIRHASMQRIKELWKPAIAYMAFPTGIALSMQGMTIAVGIVLGPLMVAVFNPMRTLTRMVYQLTDAVKNSVLPELSAAYGGANIELARRLHRTACQIAVWLAFLGCLFLTFSGKTIFLLWTHKKLPFDLTTFLLLLAVVFVNAIWNASSAVPMSSNRHGRLAAVYLVCTSTSLVVAYLLLPLLKLPATGIALLASDLFMSIYVLRMSNRLLDDDWHHFWRGMFDIRAIRKFRA